MNGTRCEIRKHSTHTVKSQSLTGAIMWDSYPPTTKSIILPVSVPVVLFLFKMQTLSLVKDQSHCMRVPDAILFTFVQDFGSALCPCLLCIQEPCHCPTNMFSCLSSSPTPQNYTLDLHVSLQLLLHFCLPFQYFLKESFTPTLFSCPHLPFIVSLLQSGFQSPAESPAVLTRHSCWKHALLCFMCPHQTLVCSTSQATSHLSLCLLLILSE